MRNNTGHGRPRPRSADNALTVGAAFDTAAAGGVFADYSRTEAANTLRRQRADLAVFVDYLAATVLHARHRTQDERKRAAAYLKTRAHGRKSPMGWWRGSRVGCSNRGYAIGSVNIRLVTVKVYAELAFEMRRVTRVGICGLRASRLAHKEAPT